MRLGEKFQDFPLSSSLARDCLNSRNKLDVERKREKEKG